MVWLCKLINIRRTALSNIVLHCKHTHTHIDLKRFDQWIGTRVADLTKQFRGFRVFVAPTKNIHETPWCETPPIALSTDLPSRIDRLKTDIYKQHTMPRYVHRIIHSAWLWLHDLSKNRLAKSDAYISRERVVKNREKITSSSFLETSERVWSLK